MRQGRIQVHLLLPRVEPPALLLSSSSHSLPSLEVEGDLHQAHVEALEQGLARAFHCPFRVLACLAYRRLPGTDQAEGLYVVAPSTAAWTPPPDTRWVEPWELERIAFADSSHQKTVSDWLLELQQGAPTHRVGWAKPGWEIDATEWIQQALETSGHTGIGPIRIWRTCAISCLMRIQTDQGGVMFKAAPPLFQHEPRINRFLATGQATEQATGLSAMQPPTLVPSVVAIDEKRGWLLMDEVPGDVLFNATSISDWAEALTRYARLQRACVSRTAELLALGCPDRTLAALPDAFAALAADTECHQVGERWGLTPEQSASLGEVSDRVASLCQTLDAGGIPPTLEHGDLHAGNILVPATGPVFIDWSDGCVSHPFFSMPPFLDSFDDCPLKSLENREILILAYLEPWAELMGRERLLEVFALSQVVGAAHHAVSYHRLVRSMEPRAQWEMAKGITWWLKHLLARLEVPIFQFTPVVDLPRM